jgi:hypothetical protein
MRVAARRQAGGRRIGRDDPDVVDGEVVMAGQPQRLPPQLQVWVDARKFGHLANHRQEPWKTPLPELIEDLYLKRFGRERPEVVILIEQVHLQKQKDKAASRTARARDRRQPEGSEQDDDLPRP